MNPHFVLATSTLSLLLLSGLPPADAHSWRPAPPSRVDVGLTCGGSRCEEVSHRGQRYVVGTRGQRYTIVLSNPTARWVEAVVTVDGRNILDGQRANARSRGYLLAPRDSVEIEGWRTSRREVAAFRFTTVGDSYAGRVGDARDAGTIRVEVFPEREQRVWIPEPEPWFADGEHRGAVKRHGDAAGSASESDAPAHLRRERRWRPSEQNLGTEFGESRWQPVEERDFVRESDRPAQTITLRYDDRAGLRARGVLDPPPRWRPHERWVTPPPR